MASSGTLQDDFHRAAREFGVPEPLLLAVSYNESRWDDHGGAPSTSGGYGVMYLTHVDRTIEVDARGDGVLHRVTSDPALHTLDMAARLLGIRARVLERDPAQNIRGGAALLARYARETHGRRPESIGQWYGAVARYSGSPDMANARRFADTVYRTMRDGEARITANGQYVHLAPIRVRADARTVRALHLHSGQNPQVECPPTLSCNFIPAAYLRNNPKNPKDYGNYDVTDRPSDGLDIRYIVIHDTETPYDSTIRGFQNPRSYASSNYVIRSADGQVTQMVPTKDLAWHAGNWYINMHAIGIEHEGMAIQGASWYGEQLYQASATLVRYLALRYHIPLDRAHIIGHDDVPGPTPATQTAQHWDPGPYWDWQHYMDLLGAPLNPSDQPDTNIVTIDPPFATNQPPVTYCYSTGDCRSVPAQPSNFLYLRTAPSPNAPLLSDPALHVKGEVGTTKADDWGDKAVTGQQFYRVDEQGDWDAIDYGGQEAWFYNPGGDTVTIPGSGQLITPRAGLSAIKVYGRAYPESAAYPPSIKKPQKIVPLQYSIPAGQKYVATDLLTSDYYWSPTQAKHDLVLGSTTYYQIFFNHRLAFVKASDVTVVSVLKR